MHARQLEANGMRKAAQAFREDGYRGIVVGPMTAAAQLEELAHLHEAVDPNSAG